MFDERGKFERKQQGRKLAGTAEAVGTQLLVVDQAPYLRNALKNCKRLRNELRKKQALLKDFEERDNAEFRQWINSNFGPALSKIRDLEETVRDYFFILETLDWCRARCPGKLRAVHAELFQRKAKGTLGGFVAPEPDVPDEEWDDDFDDDDDDEDADFFEESAKEFFDSDEAFDSGYGYDDDVEDDVESGGGNGGGFGFGSKDRASKRKRSKRENSRLKSLYRVLAKRLHPDHSKLEGALRTQRWHELQDAYQRGDLEAMLRVEAVCDMDESGLSVELGLARLRDLAKYHKAHLEPLRQALREAKRHPAFGFAKNGPQRGLHYMVESDLRMSVEDLDNSIRHLRRTGAEFLREAEELERQARMEARAAEAARMREAVMRESVRSRRPEPEVKTAPPKRKPAAERAKAQEKVPEQMSFF